MVQLGRGPGYQVPPILVPDEAPELESGTEPVQLPGLQVPVEQGVLPHPGQVQQSHPSVQTLQGPLCTHSCTWVLIFVPEHHPPVEWSLILGEAVKLLRAELAELLLQLLHRHPELYVRVRDDQLLQGGEDKVVEGT